MKRRIGLTLVDVVAATSVGAVLVGAACVEIARQHRDLLAVRADAHAQSALRAAGERLRLGALPLPAAGPAVTIADAPKGLSMTVMRAPTRLDPRLVTRGLAAVTLRAEWRDDAGRPTSRQLVVVVQEGP